MLRPLLLVAAMGSAAAQPAGCETLATIVATPCGGVNPPAKLFSDGYVANPDDSTALTYPAWHCDQSRIRVGENVPVTIEISNQCNRGGEAVAAELLPSTTEIQFACKDFNCESAGDPMTNVLTYQGDYIKATGIDTDFVLTAPGRGTLTINAKIPLAPGEKVVVGTILTKAISLVEFGDDRFEFTTLAESSDDFVSLTELDKCIAQTRGGEGALRSYFSVAPPPSPPPPPDCCTETNRNCLARCEQCVNPGAVAVDGKGVACTDYCDRNCAIYPTTESKQCFSRCSQCAQGTHTVDAEGQACSACDSCFVYDKCMKSGVCAVGCVAGRRQRKLLFAPLPVCEPCCRPIVA